jgi:PAS domain S-box-containing protein
MEKAAMSVASRAGVGASRPAEGRALPAGESPASEDVFFRRIVEGMRCAILTVDRGGRVLTMNRMAGEILEIERPDVEGLPVQEVLSGHPRLVEILLASPEMSHLPNRAELEIRSREDDGRTIGFTISPIGSDGVAEGIALFFKDLTQVERQEEQERLRDRLAALGQMAASMAHELRNPLASIEVTATLLRRRLHKRESGDDVALVNKITAEVQRLNRTVTQGLEFARPVAPELVAQSLAKLLDLAWDQARNRCDHEGVELAREYEPDLEPVSVDPQLMLQVFENLIVNALEAMGGSGRLTLGTRAVRRADGVVSGVEATVTDDGPGIPKEVREKIFYPFVTTKKHGSGIGLAMARKIVECHHGLIDVADGDGGGTCFRLRLPCSFAAGEAVTGSS